MAVRFKASGNRKKAFVELPVAFFDKYLPKANGDYLKIYLYGLKACVEKKPVTDTEIADSLGILPADVANAWTFWENEGLISYDNGMIEFENPKNTDFSEPVLKKEKQSDNFENVAGELESNEKFRETVATIEAVYPRLLSQNDILTLYDIIITQGISVDLFLITAAHCLSMKKNHFNYISKVLTDAYQKGYTTPEAMEQYYASRTESMQTYGRIKRILKIYGRDLVDKEKEFIDKWLKEKKTDEEIKEAFEKTVLNTSKLSFPYMDKILCGDKRNNFAKAPSVKAGPLNNFSQEMPDFKSIEEIVLEKQRNF